METLILKIVISSAVLLGFYHLFLAKERIFKFNRIFLVSSLLFAYSLPFIPMPNYFESSNQPNLIFGEPVQQFQQVGVNTAQHFDWSNLILGVYLSISTLFLVKFIHSFLKIKLLKGEKRIYKDQRIVVLNQDYAPFSFLKTMYFGEKYLVDNQIDERIFLHEKCHTTEVHTADILLIEFFKIFSWFNPALYFYKNAMIINHEFLADEFVLKNRFDISTYQHLILHEITNTQSLKLTHQFDFNNTKKRFIMMTTKNSRFSAIKKIAVLPLLAILFVFFSKEIQAQTEASKVKVNSLNASEKQAIVVPIDEKNATPAEKELLKAFEKVRKENIVKNDTVKKKNKSNVDKAVAPTSVKEDSQKFTGILPQFPGGINEFRKLINANFDTSVFKGDEGMVKTVLYVEIDENGKMGAISADGASDIFNREAIRSVSVVKDKVWTPATENGIPVKYVFKMPLTIAFSGAFPTK